MALNQACCEMGAHLWRYPLWWEREPGPGQSGSGIRLCESSQSQRGCQEAGDSGSLPRPRPPPPAPSSVQRGGLGDVPLSLWGVWRQLAHGWWPPLLHTLLPRKAGERTLESPPPVLDPLSMGACRSSDLLQVGPSGPCSSFSAPVEHPSPSSHPTRCTFLFSRGLCWLPLFLLHQRGPAHLRAKVAGSEATKGSQGRGRPAGLFNSGPGSEMGNLATPARPWQPQSQARLRPQPSSEGPRTSRPSALLRV